METHGLQPHLYVDDTQTYGSKAVDVEPSTLFIGFERTAGDHQVWCKPIVNSAADTVKHLKTT